MTEASFQPEVLSSEVIDRQLGVFMDRARDLAGLLTSLGTLSVVSVGGNIKLDFAVPEGFAIQTSRKDGRTFSPYDMAYKLHPHPRYHAVGGSVVEALAVNKVVAIAPHDLGRPVLLRLMTPYEAKEPHQTLQVDCLDFVSDYEIEVVPA